MIYQQYHDINSINCWHIICTNIHLCPAVFSLILVYSELKLVEQKRRQSRQTAQTVQFQTENLQQHINTQHNEYHPVTAGSHSLSIDNT